MPPKQPKPPKKDEGGEKSTSSLQDPFVVIILLLILFGVFQRAPGAILKRTGINVLHPVQSFRHLGEMSAYTPLGTKVGVTTGTDIFSAAQQGTLVGFQPSDVRGVLTGGPEIVESERWWNVDFVEGADGWVAERVLENLGPGSWVAAFISTGTIILFIVSFFLLALLVYFTVRVNQIRAGEQRKLRAQLPEDVKAERNERWEQVLTHVSSESPGDWRLAIIEADIILDELVTRMGYRGASLGDKLKQVEPSDFLTLDSAWEAHKTRNRVAHSGSDFILTQREARRIVDLYTQVFKEFHYL